MSFWSVLKAIGNGVKKVFESHTFQVVEQVAEGVIPMAFPALSPLFNLVAHNVKTVEANFAAIGQASGTGTQKAAVLVQSIGNLIEQGLQDAGSKLTVQQYIDLVVGILNTTPAGQQPQVPAQG